MYTFRATKTAHLDLVEKQKRHGMDANQLLGSGVRVRVRNKVRVRDKVRVRIRVRLRLRVGLRVKVKVKVKVKVMDGRRERDMDEKWDTKGASQQPRTLFSSPGIPTGQLSSTLYRSKRHEHVFAGQYNIHKC